jgi:hypothetical protein
MVSGNVYHAGLRPRDSKDEDIIVAYISATPAHNPLSYVNDQQNAVLAVNIFVPDIDPWQDGVLVEDKARCAVLEQAAAEWVESLAGRTEYRIRLYDTIHTTEVTGTGQHCVVVSLRVDYCDT